MRFVLRLSIAMVWTLAFAVPASAQTDPESAFLQLVSGESNRRSFGSSLPAQPIPATAEAALTAPVGHEASDPVAEGISQSQFDQPTPVAGHGFAGVSPANFSTEDPPATIGPRLDTTYHIVRGIETGVFLSEHQDLFLAGATIIPFQTPCWLLGVRNMGGYVDNLGYTDGQAAYSLDAFFGTRYKKLYSKVGFLMDDFQSFSKLGITASTLTECPIIGTCTADMAYGFRNLPDEIYLDDRNPFTFRARRVQQCDNDFQLRIGKFCTERFQFGATYNYYDFENSGDEWGAGGFVSLNLGRFAVTGDLTGGEEGLRGYIRMAWSFGAHPCATPRDCRVSCVNAIAWVSRPTDRDQSIRLHESYTGPLPLVP